MPPLTKWILPAWIAGESDLGDHRQPCKAGTLSVGSPRTLLHDASELWLKCRQYITQARCNVSAELDFHCLLAGSRSLLPFAPPAPAAPNNHSHRTPADFQPSTAAAGKAWRRQRAALCVAQAGRAADGGGMHSSQILPGRPACPHGTCCQHRWYLCCHDSE